MRIHTRLVYQLTDEGFVLVNEEGFNYSGPIALAKGDDIAAETERMQQQNMQVQMQFQSQLMDIFKQQFGKQQEVMDYLKSKVQPIIDAGGKGYSDDALATMRTSATDTTSVAYQNAQRALQATRFAQGSRDIPSGVDDQLQAALMQSEASDKATAQNQITLKNEDLKQTNYWNALNELNGIGASYNPQSYAGEATAAGNTAVGAGNSVANLSQAVTASKQSGIMGMLGGLAGGVFGAAGQAKGFGALFSCHVAAAVFNEDFFTGVKTNLVRNYLWTDFGTRWYGFLPVWLYGKTSKWVAKQKILVWALTPLFKLALRKAEAK